MQNSAGTIAQRHWLEFECEPCSFNEIFRLECFFFGLQISLNLNKNFEDRKVKTEIHWTIPSGTVFW